jgi:hypothetical protein
MLSYKLWNGTVQKIILYGTVAFLIYGTDQKRRQDSERVRTITIGPKVLVTFSSSSLPGRYGAKKKPAVSTR